MTCGAGPDPQSAENAAAGAGRGLSLFITHNLAVVEYLAHDIAVMYLGRIVECGTAAEVLAAPRHPYTQALLSAVLQPRLEEDGSGVQVLAGEIPSPARPPAGCHFHPRCPEGNAGVPQQLPCGTAVDGDAQGELPLAGLSPCVLPEGVSRQTPVRCTRGVR